MKVYDVDHYCNGPVEGANFDDVTSSMAPAGYNPQQAPFDNRTGYSGKDDRLGRFGVSNDVYDIGIKVLDETGDTVVGFVNATNRVHWYECIGGDGKGKAILEITHYTPCNNWRVAAGIAGTGLANKPVRVSTANGFALEYFDGTRLSTNDTPANGTASRSTQTLTVWRKLFLEEDYMEEADLQEGTVAERSVQGAAVTNGQGLATLNTELLAVIAGQWRSGRAQFYEKSDGFMPTYTYLGVDAVTGNTAGTNVNVTLANPTPANVNHIWIADDDVFGFLGVSADGDASPKTNATAPNVSYMNDASNFPAACIWVTFETLNGYDNSDVDFDLHVSSNMHFGVVGAAKGTLGGNGFWVATACIGYEYDVRNSNDPDWPSAGSTITWGISCPYWYSGTPANSCGGFMVYAEGVRDYAVSVWGGATGDSDTERNQRTVAHECGHVLGGRHPDGGLMSAGDAGTGPGGPKFSGMSLRRFMLLQDGGPGTKP